VLKIKEKTKALKGFKIAVMGCIVNGPGEMADADYGYVGAGKDKVHLYYKQKLIKKNVDASEAVDVLLNLIKKQEKFQ
jgi:(E)-4-hydroxy-3-methylbut-2-enyl-diphosphate synthase